MELLTLSRLTCPHCGFTEELEMPVDACQFFHQCRSCEAVLRPQTGDCCVFCSYGEVKCPSMQQPLGNNLWATSSRQEAISRRIKGSWTILFAGAVTAEPVETVWNIEQLDDIRNVIPMLISGPS